MKELSPTDKSKGCKLTKIGLLEASFTQRSPFLRFKYKKRILMYTIPVCVGVCACARTCAQTVKDPPVMQETWVESLGWKDALEEGMATHSSSCLENSMDRGAWQVTVHGVAKSWTRLSD